MKSIGIFSLAFALTLPLSAHAEWSQGKPIKLVVPFPAGGGADIIARTLSEELSKNIGQKIIIENRAGAGGSLGTEMALREKADGRTLIYVTNGTLGTNPVLYPKVGYNVDQDIEPVARLTEISLVMAVNSKRIKVQTLADFLSYAQKSSVPLTYSSAGNGTTSHLAGVLLGKLTHLPFEHIPYRGGAASITDVLAGRIDFTIDVAPNVWPHVQAGRLTALGLGANHSHNLSSDLRTIAENGVPGYELFAWDGIVVRKGTPEPIVKALSEAIEKTLANEKIQENLIARGAYPVQSTPEGFRLFLTAEKKKWAELVKTSQTSLD